jgi:hypothetical protein
MAYQCYHRDQSERGALVACVYIPPATAGTAAPAAHGRPGPGPARYTAGPFGSVPGRSGPGPAAPSRGGRGPARQRRHGADRAVEDL